MYVSNVSNSRTGSLQCPAHKNDVIFIEYMVPEHHKMKQIVWSVVLCTILILVAEI